MKWSKERDVYLVTFVNRLEIKSFDGLSEYDKQVGSITLSYAQIVKLVDGLTTNPGDIFINVYMCLHDSNKI